MELISGSETAPGMCPASNMPLVRASTKTIFPARRIGLTCAQDVGDGALKAGTFGKGGGMIEATGVEAVEGDGVAVGRAEF